MPTELRLGHPHVSAPRRRACIFRLSGDNLESMLPPQPDVEVPLLRALADQGGTARPRDLYDAITAVFPDITDADLAEVLETGGSRWQNRIQWARQALIQKGDMFSPQRGVWGITDQGRARLAQEHSVPGSTGSDENPIDLIQLHDDHETRFKESVLEALLDLTPTQFEHVGGALLRAYGFKSVHVTQRSKDGGIDGHGELRLGLATMRAAFQCKRYQNTVQRPDIDTFRGAIQGQYEQGVFLTTSKFSSGAREVSFKPGAVPIVLLDGPSIVTLMIEKGVGVQRRPLYVYSLRLGEAVGGDEDNG